MVPKVVKESVLAMAISPFGHPWAGHLEKYKTTAHNQLHFHRPGLHKVVAHFCQSSLQCHQTSARLPTGIPFHPVRVVHTPCECDSMDFVGPV